MVQKNVKKKNILNVIWKEFIKKKNHLLNCKRKRCCQYSKIGTEVTKLKCEFEGADICKEVVYTTCRPHKTKENCTRKRCCTYGLTGTVKRKILCEFSADSKEYCAETHYEQCKNVPTRKNCQRKRCCLYGKKR